MLPSFLTVPIGPRQPRLRRRLYAAAGMVLACLVGIGSWINARAERTARGLHAASAELASLTGAGAAEDRRRPAIMWGYAERQRLGLESPFRLIEEASLDDRLTPDQRRTVSWALLARVVRGESHQVDAAALDQLGPWAAGRSVAGEEHLALIGQAVRDADDPRAGELAVRLAYTLAASERIVDGLAPLLAAETAALIADAEIARREARSVIGATRSADPIATIRGRRARREFYVERPVLLAPDEDVEREAIAAVPGLLAVLRAMRPVAGPAIADSATSGDPSGFAPRLFAAGSRLPPAAPLTVTAQRYLPLLRNQLGHVADAVGRARNTEMLVAGLATSGDSRAHRRVAGRLVLAAAVAMRSMAQESVAFAQDTVGLPDVAAAAGAAAVVFDADVPQRWRPYFGRVLVAAVQDLRSVLPTLDLAGLRIRFRMTAPAESALAMHDPRTRTLHLPVSTAAGTLVHEIAHDLDRQSAIRFGVVGYRSDHAARGTGHRSAGSDQRVAASLRTLAGEMADSLRGGRTGDRPAEIFATRVDWFVASALARKGISSGFLSAVQDEMLTGYAVHADRLRSVGRSRSLLTALEGMTSVAPFAGVEPEPGAQALVRWALAGPVDRRIAADIVRGTPPTWRVERLFGDGACERTDDWRVALVRLAADSRARGWLRQRARWTQDGRRPGWAHAASGTAPWSQEPLERRVTELAGHILLELAASEDLPVGITAYARPIADAATCSRAP